MIEIRNVKEEIDLSIPRQKTLEPEVKERLSILKHKIDSVEYHKTTLKDYENWVIEYNEILERITK